MKDPGNEVDYDNDKDNDDDDDDDNDDDDDDNDDDNEDDDDRFLNVIVPFGKGAKNLTIPT